MAREGEKLSSTPINTGGTAGPGNETITYPLNAAIRAAYEDLYEATKKSLEQTNDPQTVQELTGIQLQIGSVIAADDDAHEAALDSDFADLKKKVSDTNTSLKAVQGHMADVAKKIGVVGDVVNGITAVLGFFPSI